MDKDDVIVRINNLLNEVEFNHLVDLSVFYEKGVNSIHIHAIGVYRFNKGDVNRYDTRKYYETGKGDYNG